MAFVGALMFKTLFNWSDILLKTQLPVIAKLINNIMLGSTDKLVNTTYHPTNLHK